MQSNLIVKDFEKMQVIVVFSKSNKPLQNKAKPMAIQVLGSYFWYLAALFG